MKRIILIIVLLILGYKDIFSQNTIFIKNDSNLINLINNFIEVSGKNSITVTEHAVFVIYGFDADSLNNSHCFTLGYIFNHYDYDDVCAKYYFELNNNIVLISIKKSFNLSYFDCFAPKMIYKEMEDKIKKRLSHGGVTGRTRGLIYCQENEKINSTFYINSDEIPIDKSIWCKILGNQIR